VAFGSREQPLMRELYLTIGHLATYIIYAHDISINYNLSIFPTTTGVFLIRFYSPKICPLFQCMQFISNLWMCSAVRFVTVALFPCSLCSTSRRLRITCGIMSRRRAQC